VLVLDPQDATARARGRQGRDAGASPSVASAGSEPPAPAPKPAADPALGKQLVAEGLRLLDQGRMDEARRKLRSAMKANARDGAAVAGLAALAFEEAKYARAVELADQALALNRRLVSAHLIRGDANFKLLRYDDARRAWEEVLRLDPGNPRAKRRMQTAKQSRE
jgi:tetratricopeptide (TPR) repeat protein